MAMRGWSRRSRRGTLGESDTAFACSADVATAPPCVEVGRGEHEKPQLPGCSVSCTVAEQAGTKLGQL